jgi:uncharacterized protein (TIGR01777 family)
MPCVIVAGGTGFIGIPLSLRLVEKGFDVVCLTRRALEANRSLGGSGIKFVGWDGKSASGWVDYAEGAKAIINLAGESIGSGRWTFQKKQRILQSRLNAGEAVKHAVRSAKRKPEVVIQASAIGFYGSRGSEILDETSSPGSGFLADVASKWEESTREVETLGVRRVIIRTGVVLGSGGGALSRLLLPYRFFVGGPIGNGNQWMSWLHIQDEVESILFLLERPDLKGIFNLSSPHPVQNKIFSRELGRALKRPNWLPIPGFLLKVMLGKMAEETILTSQRVFPSRIEKAGYSFAFANLAGALADILGRN